LRSLCRGGANNCHGVRPIWGALLLASIIACNAASAGEYTVERINGVLTPESQANLAELLALAQKAPRNLVVLLNVANTETDLGTLAGINQQKAAVALAMDAFVARYGSNLIIPAPNSTDYAPLVKAQLTPVLSATFNFDAIAQLATDPLVVSFEGTTGQRMFLAGTNAELQISQLPPAIAATAQHMVAVVDMGVDTNHAHLSGRALGGACFGSPQKYLRATRPLGPDLCALNNSIVTYNQPGQPAPAGFACKNNTNYQMTNCGHGTHVAGIAVGGVIAPNSAGMAPTTPYLSVQATSLVANEIDSIPYEHGVQTINLVRALDWVFENRNAGGKTLAAVNLSLGEYPYVSPSACQNDNKSTTISINRLIQYGVSVVAATGNFGGGTAPFGMAYPACLTDVLSVGAIDRTGNAASTYSTFGFGGATPKAAKLLAPGGSDTGVGIAACSPNSAICAPALSPSGVAGAQQEQRYGTSMSAPHVAGLIARLRDQLSADRAQIEALLVETGTPVNVTLFGNSQPDVIPKIAPLAAFKAGSEVQNLSTQAQCASSQISWSTPRYFPPTSYSIRTASTQAGLASAPVINIGNTSSYNLNASTWINVRANRSNNREGAWSTALQVTVTPCAPGAIRSFIADRIGTGSGYFCWGATANTSSYQMEDRPIGSAFTGQATISAIAGLNTAGSLDPLDFPDVKAKVRACNSSGCGDWSAEAELRDRDTMSLPPPGYQSPCPL
jgi:Subtilase family